MNQKRTQSRMTPTAVIAAVIVTLLAVPASAVLAGTETYSIDGSHSSVGFSIVHFFSKVPGRFTKVEGTFEIDIEDLSQGMVTITIDATSIDTDNDDRDKHLRSEDFFDVARHPKITFVSTKLMADGKNKTRVGKARKEDPVGGG